MRILISTVALLMTNPIAYSESLKAPHSVEKSAYGKTPDGQEIDLYTLTNANGMKAKIITYGGILTELWVPDRDGKMADVVLGHDNLKSYMDGHPYFGALIGRVGNRIAKGKFTLDGKEYNLATNNGPNSLHGGKLGFDKVVWRATTGTDINPWLKLTYTSKDGEEGYPGNLTVTVTYFLLSDKNNLVIDYEAKTDKATPINLTNHSYFNLKGHDQGDILDHEIEINANEYTPTDDTLIPTGKIEPVKGTPYDLTTLTPIRKKIGDIKGEPGGYDMNFVLNDYKGRGPRMAARVVEPKSGRTVWVSTLEPGLQFYTGNFLKGTDKGKGGAVYNKNAGFCLETQHFPDSVNQPNFPSTILKPGTVYNTRSSYSFGTDKK